MKIAFCGPSGAGKSTAAKYLVKAYGGTILSFAARLKEVAFELGWDGQKDERGRRFLQQLGQTVREYDPDFWANVVRGAAEQMGGNGNVCVDDLRFANEVDILRALDFKIVYLVPHGLDMSESWRRDASEQFDPNHADIRARSEIGWIHGFERTLDCVVESLFPGVVKQGTPSWKRSWGQDPDATFDPERDSQGPDEAPAR